MYCLFAVAFFFYSLELQSLLSLLSISIGVSSIAFFEGFSSKQVFIIVISSSRLILSSNFCFQQFCIISTYENSEYLSNIFACVTSLIVNLGLKLLLTILRFTSPTLRSLKGTRFVRKYPIQIFQFQNKKQMLMFIDRKNTMNIILTH